MLVTTAPARVPALPDTPTMAELGYKDLTFIGWFGLLAPTGTPQDILDKLNAEAKAISQTPAYRERMQKIHVEAVGDSPAEFKALIDAESEKLISPAQIRKSSPHPDCLRYARQSTLPLQGRVKRVR